MSISLWQWFPRRKWRIVGEVSSADMIPKRIPRHGVVVVGQLSGPKWAAFDCPCSSAHRIMVNLDPANYPAWTIERTSPLTMAPSFDVDSGNQRCHFFIKDERINWA